MRKKKENIKINSDPEIPKTPALETEREERYEAISGERSTEDLGPRYTTEPRFERSIQTGDGPLAGESLEPPVVKGEIMGHRRRKRRKLRAVGRHAAARSTKSI